jgi:hypothetical protein
MPLAILCTAIWSVFSNLVVFGTSSVAVIFRYVQGYDSKYSNKQERHFPLIREFYKL